MAAGWHQEFTAIAAEIRLATSGTGDRYPWFMENRRLFFFTPAAVAAGRRDSLRISRSIIIARRKISLLR